MFSLWEAIGMVVVGGIGACAAALIMTWGVESKDGTSDGDGDE